MQIALFTIAPGDAAELERLNAFLRSHRVLTLDRNPLGRAARLFPSKTRLPGRRRKRCLAD